jgi:hypothetical protein
LVSLIKDKIPSLGEKIFTAEDLASNILKAIEEGKND